MGAYRQPRLTSQDARKLSLPTGSVDLIVTSPPFLNEADYLLDNWLEFWFAQVDAGDFAANLIQTPFERGFGVSGDHL